MSDSHTESGKESFQSPQGARSSKCPKEDQERLARRLGLIALGSKGAHAACREQSGAGMVLPAAGSQQMRGVDGQQPWPSLGSWSSLNTSRSPGAAPA